MAEIYNRTLVETKATMLLIPQSARVLAKNSQILKKQTVTRPKETSQRSETECKETEHGGEL